MSAPRFERYVALGDSSTEGLVDPYPGGRGYRGWADRLAEHAAERNPDLLYANLAIRGRKLEEIHAEQLPPALEMSPDLATVTGGINDMMRREVDLDAVLGHLDAMVGGLSAAGATVLTATYLDPSRIITLAGGKIAERVAAFNAGVREIAQRHSAALADFERDGVADPRLWAPDRLHANSAGHERIARAAAVALGVLEPGGGWLDGLPDTRPRPRPVRVAADVAWAGRFMTPWVVRRLRGRSSGDGRVAKRPELRRLSR